MENNPINYEYLCVDNYLTDFLQTQVLKSAFEIGIIDLLLQDKQIDIQALCSKLSIDMDGAGLLIDMLGHSRVLEKNNSKISITDDFLNALQYRDLLEAKIGFANFMVPDLMNNFSDYIQDMNSFMQQSAIFDLFSYHRCYESTPDNLATTRKWMKYTTILTRYEAGAFLKHHSVSGYDSVMDIGGNSGEFILQLCRSHPDLKGTVIDLPVVCDIGTEHIREHAEADRISFYRADALTDELPTGFDLVTFKSILHDWPDEAVDTYISKAYDCLTSEGKLVIFERVKSGKLDSCPVYGNLPVFIFMRFYRGIELYQQILEKYGFGDVKIITVQLEMPFVIISAKKK